MTHPSAPSGRSRAAWTIAAIGIVGAAAGGYVYTTHPGLGTRLSVSEGRTLIDRYCVDCHDEVTRTANLSLEQLDLSDIGSHAEIWEKVARKLRAGMMPPPDIERPSPEEYTAFREFVESEIDRKAVIRPGTKVLHRLNRTEYANAIRDLLDIEIDPALYLPADDSNRGFDNIAGSLTISPTLIEAYVSAAARIARMAVGYWRSPTESLYVKRTDSSQVDRLEGLPLGTRGGIAVDHVFPADGEYKITVRNLDVGAFVPDEQLEFSIDGERMHLWEFSDLQPVVGMIGEGYLEVTLPIRAGTRQVGVTFVATNYRPSIDVARHFDRKSLENGVVKELTNYPMVGALVIQGPFSAERPTDSRSLRKVFSCRPARAADEEACATEIVSTLTARAFRRPVTAGDLELVMGFYEDGRRSGSFEEGIEFALRRLLASPQFLIRAEEEPANLAPGEIYRISDIELASRLSFFLWSSIPDDELVNIASRGELGDPLVLEAQVRRMLADPRSQSLVENFAQQWLYLRNLDTTAPAQTVFPDWDDELRKGFRRETELLFEHVMREDRSVLELLTADYTFVNERLARHYGITGVYGAHFRRVELGPDRDYRRGLLGHGSFLSTTWVQNNRTSPVKRGVWVLDNILGTPPPEPPPDVPGLEETDAEGPDRMLTLREQMELHRTAEPCASCHRIMDSIGFALENFAGDARWRDRDGGAGGTPIDAHVVLWDGTEVNGPVELREAILDYAPQFMRVVTEKLMTYGLGRGVEYYDMPVVRSIVREVEQNDNRFSSIVLGIVTSAPFQMRTKSAEPIDGEDRQPELL